MPRTEQILEDLYDEADEVEEGCVAPDEAEVELFVGDVQTELPHLLAEADQVQVQVPIVDDEPINYQKCREHLDDFFKKRVFGYKTDPTLTRWNLSQNLPRKGKDTEFDALLRELKILSNRRYQSQRWLLYKKSKGISPPPSYKWDIAEELYTKICEKVSADTIIGDSIKATKEIMPRIFKGLPSCVFLAESQQVNQYLVKEINRICHAICRDVLQGATPSTIDKKVADFTIAYTSAWRKEFIDHVMDGCTESYSQPLKENVRIFLGELHDFVYKKWSEVVRSINRPNMEEDVDNECMADRLQGSEATLYYLAGWLLLRLCSAKLRGLDSRVLKEFATHNEVSADYASESMPSREVERRENKRKRGALRRSGTSWFAFVCLLESLYIVNLNALQTLHHRGKILERIGEATRRSMTLRQRFLQCIPEHFGDKERKSLWRAYFMLILPAYGKMKSSDVLKLIRQAKPSRNSDKLPTRVKAVVAHESAKTKS